MQRITEHHDQRLLHSDAETSTAYTELPVESNAPIRQARHVHPAFSSAYPAGHYPAQQNQRQAYPVFPRAPAGVPQEAVAQGVNAQNIPPQYAPQAMVNLPVSLLSAGQPYSICIRDGGVYLAPINSAPVAPRAQGPPCMLSFDWFSQQNEKLKGRTCNLNRGYLLISTVIAMLGIIANLFAVCERSSISLVLTIILFGFMIRTNVREIAYLCDGARPKGSCGLIVYYIFYIVTLVVIPGDIYGWRNREVKQIDMAVLSLLFIFQLAFLIVDRNSLRKKAEEQRVGESA